MFTKTEWNPVTGLHFELAPHIPMKTIFISARLERSAFVDYPEY
jgi:hypothetical protein